MMLLMLAALSLFSPICVCFLFGRINFKIAQSNQLSYQSKNLFMLTKKHYYTLLMTNHCINHSQIWNGPVAFVLLSNISHLQTITYFPFYYLVHQYTSNSIPHAKYTVFQTCHLLLFPIKLPTFCMNRPILFSPPVCACAYV